VTKRIDQQYHVANPTLIAGPCFVGVHWIRADEGSDRLVAHTVQMEESP